MLRLRYVLSGSSKAVRISSFVLLSARRTCGKGVVSRARYDGRSAQTDLELPARLDGVERARGNRIRVVAGRDEA